MATHVRGRGLAEVFGQRVRTLRRSRGWTQEQLAQKAGLNDKHVGAIERGDKTSSFETIEKLARAFGVDYWHLFVPGNKPTAELDRELHAIVRDAGRVNTSNVLEFLKGLRSALRKLDRETSG